MLGIAELVPPVEPALMPQQGERWIQFQLLGEIDSAGRFRRGVSTYPAVDDAVHFATSTQISSIYPPPAQDRIRLGTLSTSRGHVVSLDLGKLVTRHSAVVGSTGSGKSSTVARVLQAVIASNMERANILLIDPHGEHAAAMGHHAAVRSVLGIGDAELFVPYWAFSFDELLQVYGRGTERNPVVRNRLQDLMLQGKQEFLQLAGWAAPTAADITVDSPVPFDLRQVWHTLDYDNRATYTQPQSQGAACVTVQGNANTLTPTQFQAYALGAAAPYKGRTHGQYSPLPDTLRVRLTDPRFGFLARAFPNPAQPDPLPQQIANWLGDDRPVSVLDFSGVPTEAADIAIGAVLNLIFVAAANSTTEDGIGRARPVLIVLEEAHRFLGKATAATASFAREAAERISREGRKYGVGLMLVSQRPSELSETVLSQCGTVLSMRLTNQSDQSSVRAALPDAIASLVEALPSLRTGEALVTGEAITLPSRVVIDRPNPEPHAADPPLTSWIGEPSANDVSAAIARWRGVVDNQAEGGDGVDA
jgi:uncharacterized protein DUF87/helicase HerA-like protein